MARARYETCTDCSKHPNLRIPEGVYHGVIVRRDGVRMPVLSKTSGYMLLETILSDPVNGATKREGARILAKLDADKGPFVPIKKVLALSAA